MTLQRWTRHASIGLTWLVLAGCSQPPAQASSDQDKDAPMTSATHAPVDGEAAAERAAARFDQMAEQSAAQSAAAPAQPTATVPLGPPLKPEEWGGLIFQFIDGLRSPGDLEPSQIAKTFGLHLHSAGSEQAARGDLGEHGSYALWVNTLYRERPGKWTVGLSQEPRSDQVGCLFALDKLRQHLSARGYNATEGVRQRDGSERALYRSAPTPGGVVFVVSAQLAPGGSGCIQEVRINANTPEDEA